MVAGLSEREVDVLRLVSHGLTIKQMAVELVISEKTVDSHIQHIYNKIGVSTAGATMFGWNINLFDHPSERDDTGTARDLLGKSCR